MSRAVPFGPGGRALRFLSAFAVAALAACTPAPPVPVPAPVLADPRDVLVLTAPPAEPVIGRVRALGYVLGAVHPLPDLDDVLVVLRIPAGRTVAEAIEEIEAAVPGVLAGAHHLYRIQAEEPSRSYPDVLMRWPAGGCRALRPVGMVDAGVPPTHPGLTDGRIVQRRFTGSDAPPATDHGAMVANLLIGPGRLTGAPLYSANVVDPALPGGDAAGVVAILQAVDWLRASGVELVNVSLAGPRNKLLDRALARAAEKGMVIVAAAGNQGPAAPPQYPAAFPQVLAVTAVDRDGRPYERAIRGPHIDFAAPGVDVLVPDGGRLRLLTGTSVAAPFATAALAADPGLRGLGVEAVEARLLSRTVDLGEAGHDPVFGAGLILAPEPCRLPLAGVAATRDGSDT